MSSATQIATGRRLAEALMVDTCTIRALIRSDVLDDTTGEYLMIPNPDLPDPVYAGKCRFTIAATEVRDVDSQGQDLAVADARLDVPVLPGTALIAKDHVATIHLTAVDTATVIAIVQASHAQTFATARRLPVQITT